MAGLRPGFPEQSDLLGLELIERHLRILQQQRRAHQIHALLARPHGALARARTPPDAIREPRRLRLDGEHRFTGPATDVGADHACTGDRRTKQRRLVTRVLAIEGVAKGLGAVPGGLGRAAADAELEPTAASRSAAAASSAMYSGFS